MLTEQRMCVCVCVCGCVCVCECDGTTTAVGLPYLTQKLKKLPFFSIK